MAKRKLPTDNIEALSNFVQGRALFDSYRETRNPEELSEATECFELSSRQDPGFEIARVYWGVAETKLGNPDEAISVLSGLKQYIREDRQEFRLDVCVQLARAYAKKGEYGQAKKQLKEAENEARRAGCKNKLCLFKAYRALYCALEGAHRKDLHVLNRAACLADRITSSKLSLKDDYIGRQTRFEAETASGIARMWLGKLSKSGAETHWKNAEEKLGSALKLRPNSTQALYNMGMLFMFQGRYEERGVSLRERLKSIPLTNW
jgi:tetratricopeptide (TPR) repeat protein